MTTYIGWQLHPSIGWGRYGIELALGLQARKRPAMALAISEVRHLPIFTQARLAKVADYTVLKESVKNMKVPTAIVALGNGGRGSTLPEGLEATRTFAGIFFEDTRIDAEMVAALNQYAGVICGSTWNAKLLRAAGVERVHTVLQGVNPADWHPAPHDPVFPGRFVVFSGGKLEFRKGQDIVVAAFRQFRAKHPEALLVTAWQNAWPATMAGIDLAGHVKGVPTAGPHGIDVAGWLEKQGIPRSAAIDVGLQPNHLMPAIVRACDVAVFPNRAEGGTNLVAMECLAAGIPTIVSVNTGHEDIAGYAWGRIGDQGAVPSGCALYQETAEWGETSVAAVVDQLERAWWNWKERAVEANVGSAVGIALSWSHTVDRIVGITEAPDA